jgi:hypothetical protein
MNGKRVSTYRMRPDRFLGLFALGLIVLGIAAVLWAVGAAGTVIAAILVLGGLVTLAGLWILARPPVLARLDDDGVTVRGVRTAWTDVTGVARTRTTHGEAIAIRSGRDADHTVLVPLSWLAQARGPKLEADLRERLDATHGYEDWDGTAGGTDES